MLRNKEIVADLDSRFLNEKRRIRIYLPKGYDGQKRYPVLYMHDGQNIVRRAEASHRSWKVTKALKRMGKEVIVVGVDCVQPRNRDYYPYKIKNTISMKGMESTSKEYLSFLIDEVKPYVDGNFKTLPEREHSYLAGSSLGGCITAYCAMTRPGVFSVYGVFSPALSMMKDLFRKDFEKYGTDMQGTYFVSVGSMEHKQFKDRPMMRDLFRRDYEMYTALLEGCGANLAKKKYYVGGEHTESHWAKQFYDFIKVLP